MHRPLDSALYDGGSPSAPQIAPQFAPPVAVALFAAALATNLASERLVAIAAVAVAAVGALLWVRAPRERWRLALVLTAPLVLLALALSAFALWSGQLSTLGHERPLKAALQGIAGTTWAVWFGAAVSWPTFRRWAARAPRLEFALEAIDTSVVHGGRLLRLFVRRRQAAQLRVGPKETARLDTWARILGGGVEPAFEQAIRVEEARSLRSAAPLRCASEETLCARSLSMHHEDGAVGLCEIDLSLAVGEWVALAGPSGSGKSTLLRLLAGLSAPTHGTLERFGTPLEPGPLARRLDGRVALVFQDPDDALLGATPFDDLLWGLRRRGVLGDLANDQSEALLAALDLTPLSHRPIHRLSFGEKKRLGFAAALAAEPTLLLCDEPTSGLDPVAARHLIDLLERYAADRPRLSVVWATHDLASLPSRIERALLLDRGRLVVDAPIAQATAPQTLRRTGLLPPLERPRAFAPPPSTRRTA